MKVLKQFLLGSMDNNCYVIEVNNEITVIDAPEGIERVIQYLKDFELTPKYLFLTHGHFDHILGLKKLKNEFKDIIIIIGKKEASYLKNPDENLSIYISEHCVYSGHYETYEGIDTKALGFRFEYISGHSKASVILLFEEEKVAFVGDTLFANSIGRSDLMYGDHTSLVVGIKQHLLTLPDETKIYPGHGATTSIGIEKKQNNFLR
ncbi:MAG: MBL fold metallo-hydrolase [Spiroplasma sp.]|nr:MBL fold metallo-hydrolase [Mycoplasmatales bacterium]